jgi:hypothetical protein
MTFSASFEHELPWSWPISPVAYDQGATLTLEEHQALTRLVHAKKLPSIFMAGKYPLPP